MLRNAINNSKTSIEDIVNVVRKFNVPVVAGTVKLYLSELNPPVLGWEGWEDAKGVYPSGTYALRGDYRSLKVKQSARIRKET